MALRKRGVPFLICFRKRGVPRKGGFPQKRGGSYPGGNYALSWRRSLLYRNQSIDLLYKSMEWFLYDRDLRHETVKLENNFFVKSLWIIKNRLYRHSHIFFARFRKSLISRARIVLKKNNWAHINVPKGFGKITTIVTVMDIHNGNWLS